MQLKSHSFFFILKERWLFSFPMVFLETRVISLSANTGLGLSCPVGSSFFMASIKSSLISSGFNSASISRTGPFISTSFFESRVVKSAVLTYSNDILFKSKEKPPARLCPPKFSKCFAFSSRISAILYSFMPLIEHLAILSSSFVIKNTGL